MSQTTFKVLWSMKEEDSCKVYDIFNLSPIISVFMCKCVTDGLFINILGISKKCVEIKATQFVFITYSVTANDTANRHLY